MTVFHIYADASGKLCDSDYTSFCGYVAHVSEWQGFTFEWENRRFKWQVPPIHMSHIMHPEDHPEWLKVKTQWGTDWEAKRDAMLLDLAATVGRAAIVCVGAVVDAGHFRKIDADQKYSIMCYKLLQAMKRDDQKVKERIHSLAFVNDESFPGVQVADMVAYESRRLMVEEMKDPNTPLPPSHLLKFLTLSVTHQPLHYTPAILDQMQADMRTAKGAKP